MYRLRWNIIKQLSTPSEYLFWILIGKLFRIFYQNVSFSPNYPLGWMNLGISYVANGLYEDALTAYLKADELKPNNGKIIFNLGNLVRKISKLYFIGTFEEKKKKNRINFPFFSTYAWEIC